MTWPPEELLDELDGDAACDANLPDVSDLPPLDRVADQSTVASGCQREAIPPNEALQRFWGYDHFRPLQEEAVTAAIAGRDSLVILPTGGGKSLCYQVPTACRPGLTVVVSPLIALMDDQVAGARGVGLEAGALHSMLEPDESSMVRQAALAGRLDLLYVSPERFVVDELIVQLGSRICLVAIDEAHCISHWGHDFRPEYRQLQAVCDRLGPVPRMALTATATTTVQEDIVAQLGLRDPLRLVGHPDRPNLVYRVRPRANLVQQVREVVDHHPGEGGIVYAQTRKEVERLAAALSKAGVSCQPYHAGLPGPLRNRVQEDFLAERIDVVVATIAFGMGIDRSNVRFVVHANAPRSIEHYQQESGRAGRDGLPADCLLIYSGADFAMHRVLATLDGPLEPTRQRALERQLQGIGRYTIAPVCRHRLLTEHFGQALDLPAAGCDACDVCLGETVGLPDDEALVTAQKIISAVWRCQSRFGAAHIANVLLGRDSEQIRRNGHQDLSVFGLLSAAGDRAVRAWIDQLVLQGLLAQDPNDGYPLLVLTAAGKALCKGAGEVRLSHFPKTTGRRSGARSPAPDQPAWAGVDKDLFTNLRIWRKMVAEELGIPPYLIFSDATLREVARDRPTDTAALLGVKGIGQRKATRFGEAVLGLVAGRPPEEALGLTILEG